MNVPQLGRSAKFQLKTSNRRRSG